MLQSAEVNEDIRRLELMIMDDEGYSDEEVYEKVKVANLRDNPLRDNPLKKIINDLRLYRPLLWIKIEKETPLFYQREVGMQNM